MTRVDPTKLLTQIALFCRKTLEREKQGKELAAKLGLSDERLLEKFKVGYANASLLGAVPSKGGVRDAMVELGLIAQGGRLLVDGSLVVPVHDREGNVLGIVAVAADGRETRFPATLALYPVNPCAFRDRSPVFTGSVLEALRFVQAGVLNSIPLREAPSPEEAAFLRQNRPAKAFCDPGVSWLVRRLQELEIPCYALKVTWPASLTDINAAMKAAEPLEARLSDDATVKVSGDALRFSCGGREYVLQDLDPRDADRLRVRLKALRNGYFHLDTLDLFAARSRASFAKAATALYSVPQEAVEADLALMIRKLEAVREAEHRKRQEQGDAYSMTADEEAEALEFLKSPDLLTRIVADMGRLGYIGEETNKKLGYLVALSRKLESPLCGAIVSRSGAGKSSLMDALANMVPPEDLVRFTRITPQALYYAGQKGLRHKLLMSGEDEGLEGSDYALRELISSKKIRLAAPLRESESGKFQMTDYTVEGPIALLFSTTEPSLHFENATRCFTLSLDESAEQTRAIHEAQRRRHSAGRLEEGADIMGLGRLHQNAQRLLKPLAVVNPYALDLEFPTQPLEMRREHEKYLSLIDTIALLHQHQRERKAVVVNGREQEYVEVAIEDIEEANRLMTEVLGTQAEELSGPSRELLRLIRELVDKRAKELEVEPKAFRFNRRDIREHTGWSDSQIKAHISQLESLEYLLVSKGERGRMYRYELTYEGEKKRLPGLTDTEKLKAKVRKSGMVGNGLAGPAEQDSVGKPEQRGVESLKVGRNRERSKGMRRDGAKNRA